MERRSVRSYTTKPEVATKVFDVVEEMPSFPGGQGALMSYLASNIKYPVVWYVDAMF